MSDLPKRTTVCLDPTLHKALRLKSAETSGSISVVVNDAGREALAEDAKDLAALDRRENKPVVSFEPITTYIEESEDA